MTDPNLRAERDALEERVKRLSQALASVAWTIEHGGESLGITDTLWFTETETLLDFIRRVLSEPDVYSKPSTVNHPARCFCGEPAYHEGACIPDVREPRVDPFDRPGEGEKT